jgi:hypothetical protein
VGKIGTVMTRTQVRVVGELWRARSTGELTPGDDVTVDAVDGMTLVVRPLLAGGRAQQAAEPGADGGDDHAREGDDPQGTDKRVVEEPPAEVCERQ